MTAGTTMLDAILERTRRDLEARRATVSVEELLEGAVTRSEPWSEERRLSGALRRGGPRVIAEFKRRSPSAGDIRADADVATIASAYERAGAAAMSVLTDEPHFGGSLQDLRTARGACDLPLLRKDFVIDPYQLQEAWASGADAVLLIAAALDGERLGELYSAALALGLEPLVEVHDEAELERALELSPTVVGINNRDLRDFSVDVERTLALLPLIPSDVVVVSESGLGDAEQLRRLGSAGVHGVLIGEALMRAPDPEATLRSLTAAL